MSIVISFKAIIENAGDGGAFVIVPFDVEQFYGQRDVKIRARIDGKASRRTLVRRGEREHILPVLKEIRERIGKGFGDEVEVELVEDFEPRLLVVPAELSQLLKQNPQAASFFEGLSYSQWKNISPGSLLPDRKPPGRPGGTLKAFLGLL
jgi:hypothetical protein